MLQLIKKKLQFKYSYTKLFIYFMYCISFDTCMAINKHMIVMYASYLNVLLHEMNVGMHVVTVATGFSLHKQLHSSSCPHCWE